MAGPAGLHQAVHVDVEVLLLEGAREGAWREVLQPGEERQVKLVAAVSAEQIHAEQHLALRDLLASGFTLQNMFQHTAQTHFKISSVHFQNKLDQYTTDGSN